MGEDQFPFDKFKHYQTEKFLMKKMVKTLKS